MKIRKANQDVRVDTSVMYTTVKELAALAGVSHVKVREDVESGLLDSVRGQGTGFCIQGGYQQDTVSVVPKVCKTTLFHPDEVEAYVSLMKEEALKPAKPLISDNDKGLGCSKWPAITGLTDHVIRAHIKYGCIKPANERPLTVTRYELLKFKQVYEDAISRTSASDILGIDIANVINFMESELLPSYFAGSVSPKHPMTSRKAVNRLYLEMYPPGKDIRRTFSYTAAERFRVDRIHDNEVKARLKASKDS